MSELKQNRGGKRKGAGRKAGPHKTTPVSFRIRIDKVAELKPLIKQFIKKHTEK